MSESWFLAVYASTFAIGALLIDTFATDLRVQLSPLLFLILALELVLLCPKETT
ncbi:MAG: hypothetical protein Q8Q38_01115 [bacterium]|nr:hypothetical protein [bacterium]